MEYITQKERIQVNQETAVTLGKFDGFHLGHQLLLNEVISYKKNGLIPVVFTFLTANQLRTDSIEGNILSEKERVEFLDRYGIDMMISYPFDDEMRCMPAEIFIGEILCQKLHAKKIVVGEDFCFGYKRLGNVKLLQELSEKYGYEVIVFEKLALHGEMVGSTAIRQALKEGQIEKANEFLGRNYQIEGEVVYGNQIGRKLLNMPTANIYPEVDKLLPPNGVYVTTVTYEGKDYKGITNIGYKPTIGGESTPGVETYLFDFDENLYGKNIVVNFFTFERGECKFNGLDELKEQMQKDKAFGMEYFLENSIIL